MFEQQPPLRLENQPSLGADVIFGRNAPEPRTTPSPIPPQVIDPTTVILTHILAEVRGLRRDLAERTLAARLRRFGVWLRRLVNGR